MRDNQQNRSPAATDTPLKNPVFIIICFLIAFTPLARGSVHLWAKTLIQMSVLTGLALLLIKKSIKNESLYINSPLTLPLSATLLLAAVSTLLSGRPFIAFEGLAMLITYVIFLLKSSTANNYVIRKEISYLLLSAILAERRVQD